MERVTEELWRFLSHWESSTMLSVWFPLAWHISSSVRAPANPEKRVNGCTRWPISEQLSSVLYHLCLLIRRASPITSFIRSWAQSSHREGADMRGTSNVFPCLDNTLRQTAR